MSTHEFWYEDPDLLWTYRKVYIDKLKIQAELENQQAWRIGLYVFDALSVVVHNVLSEKGTPAINYPEKPYEFNTKPISGEEKRLQEIRKNEELIKENLSRGKRALNKNT